MAGGPGPPKSSPRCLCTDATSGMSHGARTARGRHGAQAQVGAQLALTIEQARVIDAPLTARWTRVGDATPSSDVMALPFRARACSSCKHPRQKTTAPSNPTRILARARCRQEGPIVTPSRACPPPFKQIIGSAPHVQVRCLGDDGTWCKGDQQSPTAK